ncbi:hypothetical protein [Anditalea andensis]|uniref:Lipoprotein n=1 Tax=Anditalea andensis TaxID=1048983 RepID=A0A074L3P3_9BACT|nr:hypothetical protein [Anditalea andensis]KEO75080.1 hypothetical protein EL17_05255 [Anditalea andensis]
MKNIFCALISSVLLLLASCNDASNETSEVKSLPLQVAEAYGIGNFEDINVIEYTWNVQQDSVRVGVRDWKWRPKEVEVYYSGPDSTLTFNYPSETADLQTFEHRFINDKYWLLFPFQLAWDTGYDYEEVSDQAAPISGESTTKLIIQYNEADGFTPGDAYDLYLDGDLMIKEWVFRKGGAPDGRAFTWEDVQEFKGIKISTSRTNDTGKKFIWFTNISVN